MDGFKDQERKKYYDNNYTLHQYIFYIILYIYIYTISSFISSIMAHMICRSHIIHAVSISLSLSKATLRELSRVTSGREEESRVQ